MQEPSGSCLFTHSTDCENSALNTKKTPPQRGRRHLTKLITSVPYLLYKNPLLLFSFYYLLLSILFFTLLMYCKNVRNRGIDIVVIEEKLVSYASAELALRLQEKRLSA